MDGASGLSSVPAMGAVLTGAGFVLGLDLAAGGLDLALAGAGFSVSGGACGASLCGEASARASDSSSAATSGGKSKRLWSSSAASSSGTTASASAATIHLNPETLIATPTPLSSILHGY